ncbi:MAG TPA: hypothetical protein PKH77_21645 [Anaerolineae bacterium]|nr:hypothetical protein [Anaerolineae bacterium]
MNLYEMTQLYKELNLPESLFLTRDKGGQAYQILETQLKAIPDKHPLLVVFPPDQLVDGSFADESIIRLGEAIVTGDFADRSILLQGLTSDSITNIEAVITFRKLKLAFLLVEPTGDWKCIGQLEPSLLETLAIVANQTHITAPELADMKGLAINSASNRLKRLYNQRLVRREHEISDKGLQYIYSFWNWSE